MRTLLAVPVVALLALIAAAPAPAAQRCDDAETKYATATEMRTRGGLDCGVATAVVRTYLRDVAESGKGPRSCAKRRFTRAGCEVGDFRCRARITGDGETRGRCGDDGLRVKFLEIPKHGA